jgi:predicted heme/steroid binding protein
MKMNALKYKKIASLVGLMLLVFAVVGCSNSTSNNESTTAEAPTQTQTTENMQSSENTQGSENTDPSEASSDTVVTTESSELVLTLEELAQFNGKNGNPAYVAVDGIIYDVSNVEPWKNGQHNGYEAGQDLTEIIKTKSPHGLSVLQKLTAVGKLAE